MPEFDETPVIVSVRIADCQDGDAGSALRRFSAPIQRGEGDEQEVGLILGFVTRGLDDPDLLLDEADADSGSALALAGAVVRLDDRFGPVDQAVMVEYVRIEDDHRSAVSLAALLRGVLHLLMVPSDPTTIVVALPEEHGRFGEPDDYLAAGFAPCDDGLAWSWTDILDEDEE